MKKVLLAVLALAATIHTASAQFEIGLKVSPSVTSLRAESPSNYAFAPDGSKLGFGGGLVVDYFFGENYAFSTGLLLSGKGGTLAYSENGGVSGQPSKFTQKLTMQYLELPLTVKLFTTEVATDARLYFQVGGSLNVPIGVRINNSKFYGDPITGKETKASDHTTFYDADALVGLGAEYQLGQSTKVFGGFSYHRGLVNIDDYFEKSRGFKNVVITFSDSSIPSSMLTSRMFAPPRT